MTIFTWESVPGPRMTEIEWQEWKTKEWVRGVLYADPDKDIMSEELKTLRQALIAALDAWDGEKNLPSATRAKVDEALRALLEYGKS